MSAPRPTPRLRDDVRVAALLAAAVAVSGLLVGPLWAAVAPTAQVEVREGGVYVLEPEGQAFIAADGWFAVLGTIAGSLCASVAFARFRRHGAVALLGLTLGSVIAAVLAWRLGHLIGPGDLESRARTVAEGTTLEAPLDLRAPGVLLAWPIAAVSWFLALTLGFEPRERRPAAEPVAEPGTPDDERDAALTGD